MSAILSCNPLARKSLRTQAHTLMHAVRAMATDAKPTPGGQAPPGMSKSVRLHRVPKMAPRHVASGATAP
eukprot:11249973-Alexandrium_andersonii.AAC.1